MAQHNDNLVLPKNQSWQMFNEISPRYDFLNHFLSFNLDKRWRRILAKHLPDRSNLKILDLATGTADVLLAFFKFNKNAASAVGIDMAAKMLEIGKKKVAQKALGQAISLQEGDANQIPFNENSFDACSIAFGIRNVENPRIVLNQMHQVLKSKGRALILEFSLPNNIILRYLHLFYLRYIVPCIGYIFSRHYRAYKYLNQTIETFPYGDEFCQILRDADFKDVKAYPLLLGVATIYQGDKV